MTQLRIPFLITYFLLIVGPFCAPSTSLAATIVEGSNKKDTIITLTSAMKAEKLLHVVIKAPSSANSSFSFIADAPTGTTVKLSSLVVGGRIALESSISKSNNLVPVQIYNNGHFVGSLTNRSASLRINRSSPDNNVPDPVGERDPNCGCLAQNQIDYYIDFAHRLGLNFTRQDVCGVASSQVKSCEDTSSNNGGAGDGDSGNTDGALSGAGYLFSDACNRSAGLAAVLTFDLTKLPESVFDGTHVIQVGTLFKAYSGNRRASVKDKGAGKYSGSLLLAAPVAGFAADISAMKYATNGRLTNKQKLKAADYVYYSGGGGLLYRIPFKPTGDRRSINVHNGIEGYTFCAKMSAQRQYFNGYSN